MSPASKKKTDPEPSFWCAPCKVRVLREHSGNIQGTFREHSGNIQPSFWCSPCKVRVYTQCTFREHSGNTQCTFSVHSGSIQGTLREHSGSIQGTFREHSGNIQRIFTAWDWCAVRPYASSFREYSGNVQFKLRWTPMSPNPNCQKHFKKVPRLTQNTTCKHEYLVRGLTRPNDVSQG